jgi:hypothetical protein
MTILGLILIVAGVVLFFINPRPGRPRLTAGGLRMRGIAGPALVIIGVLILLGVIG